MRRLPSSRATTSQPDLALERRRKQPRRTRPHHQPVLTMRRAAPRRRRAHPRMPMTTIFKLAVGGSAIIAGAMGFAVSTEPLMGVRASRRERACESG